jgi:tetratricopeptide (TPR) repeat protein
MRTLALLVSVLLPAATASLLSTAGAAARAAEPVSARQEKLSMPTWEIGPPSVHPLYPGPQGRIYPYTLNETLTDRKVDRTYDAVFLENEYVRVLILPEIGGRLHGAVDKTNDYVWVYWQRTIKPGLISMTGAWISGGIEWNFPHGHRPSGYMPVDHRIVRHDDGSATVWVGETEPIFNTRWLVGMTLEPGRSRVRCDYVFINPTNHRVSFQFWATAATHANEGSQAQYPGDVVTGHGKMEFWNWPVHDGVDLTWWKNVPNASSFFAYESADDWFGTYDHGAEGGLVHVADHRLMPGKKLWTWGSGPSGRIWEDILTEGGGAYFEPQAGAWADNQPDYHWMEPHEVRTAHDYWYPVRDTRGFHNASPDFAVNTDLRDGQAFAGVYATGVFEGLRVVLRDVGSGRVLNETVTRIAPDRPFTEEMAVPSATTVHDLHLAVHDGSGRLLIELQRSPAREIELPEPPRQWGLAEGMTEDELFHCGEWLDRFRRTEEALRCYEEALRRDPADSRVNTEMGFLALKEARWEDALRSFGAALERDADSPRLHFGRALAALGLGRFDEAYDRFLRASSGARLSASAQLNLARLELRRGDPGAALERATRAEAGNGSFADIPALAAAAHRRLGQPERALAAAERALAADPMHFMGGHEKTHALRTLGRPAGGWEQTWRSVMRGSAQNHITLAEAYAEAGLFEDAEAVLDELRADEASGPGAMVHYLRGWLRHSLGDEAGATAHFERGARSPLAHANPHRIVEMKALEAAVAAEPADAHAHHLLGNLLYGLGRREEGLRHWKQAVKRNDRLALTWRNVGYAEAQLNGDDRAALEAHDRAFALDTSDARILLERDQTAERLGVPGAERRALLDRHPRTVARRDDLTKRWIDLLLSDGEPGDLESVERVLASRHFHSWEGAYELHHAWVEVQQKRGDLVLGWGDVAGARRHYERAFEYPRNLEVAPRTPDLRAHVLWSLARSHDGEQRETLLQKILDEHHPRPALGTYYQALALEALGKRDEARARLDRLEQRARALTADASNARGRAVGHYLLSLVLRERGDAAAADAELRAARELDPRPDRRALTQAQIEYARGHQ